MSGASGLGWSAYNMYSRVEGFGVLGRGAMIMDYKIGGMYQ